MQGFIPSFSEIDDTRQNVVSQKTAKDRAGRYAFAGGVDDPAQISQIEQQILNGNEKVVKESLAEKSNASVIQTRSDIVKEISESARKVGRPLTGEEQQIMLNAPDHAIQSPETILESEFSKKYLSSLLAVDKGDILLKSLEEEPEFTNAMLDVAEGIVQKKMVLKRFREEQEDRKSEQGIGGAALDFAATLLPFRETFGVAAELGGDDAGFLELIAVPGQTLQDKIQELYMIPSTQEFNEKVKEIIDNLASENLNLVDRFLTEMDNISNNTARFTNLWNGFEGVLLATDVIGIGAIAKGAGKASAKAARKAAQDVAQGVSDSTGSLTPSKVLNAVGDVRSASTLDAVSKVKAAYVNGATTYDEILKTNVYAPEMVPTIFRWDRIIKETPNLSTESTRRLVREMSQATDEGLENFLNTKGVRRRTDDVLAELVEKAQDTLKLRYDGTKGSVIDNTFRSIDQGDTAENLGRVYALIGDAEAKGWKNPSVARSYAINTLRIPVGNFDIKQKGQHFFIETFQDLDESLGLENLGTILKNPETTTPVSFTNTFIGFLRNPADVLPKFQNIQRDVSTFASNETLRVMKEQAELIPAKLNKKQRNELVRTLEALRDYTHSDGTTGRFAQDTFDFEKTFASVNGGRAPTESQVESYFRAVLLNDFEHFVRNLQLRKDKARLGMQEVTLSGVGEKAPVIKLEAKVVDSLPMHSKENFGLLAWDNSRPGSAPVYLRKGEEGWDKIEDFLKVAKEKGFKLLQVADETTFHFNKDFGIDEKTNFILVSQADIAPLSMKQLPYNPGFHKIYRDPWYAKQTVIHTSSTSGRRMVKGDKSVINASSEAEAKAQVKMLEEARSAYNRGNRNEFNTTVTKMGRDPDELWDRFRKGEKDPTDAKALDPSVRFTVTRAGTRTQELPEIEKYLKENGVEDLIDSEFNLYRNIQKKFTGERDPDLDTSNTLGSENNPIYRLERPRLIDPLDSINKGLTNVMRARAMEDYKIQAMDHYIAEFGGLMRKDTNELLQNPMDALYNPAWKDGVDSGKLAAAKNTQRAIKYMLGTPSELQEKINWTYDKLVSSVWQKYGTDTANKVSDRLVWTTTDPFQYARAFAFHTKLGLFNPVQLWLQAQTWSNIVGIAPKEVLPASSAAFKMASLRFTNNKDIINRIAGMGEGTLGMTQKQFLESYEAMRKTGIFTVGGEVAWRDDLLDPKVHTGVFSKFLEKGTMFFQEGERFSRLTAWNTAYLQWRKANPGAKLTDTVIGQLVNRTNDLTVNMIRSNNPMYQQGIFSIPTQFWSYQLRMTELYLGKRLSTAEKIRMFSAHSVLYGVPVATGAVTGVFPWYEDMREQFLERGIDVDNPATKTLLSGLPSVLLKGITGRDYDFAGRYGPGGLNIIKEIANEEKTFVELLGGASASIILDSASTAAPAWTGMVNYMLNREGPQLTSTDFSRAFSTVSSVNQINKAYHMVTAGKYITKNGINLGDADGWDAFMIAAFGLTSQEISDTFIRIQSMKDFENEKKAAFKEYSRNIRLFMNATDIEDKTTYLNNAKVFLQSTDLLPKERAQWIYRAFKDVDVVEQTQQDFWQKSPTFQREQRMKAFIANQKNKEQE